MPLDRPVEMRPADLEPGLEIGEHEARVLEVEHDAGECLAILGEDDGLVERLLRRGLRADRDCQPLLRQLAHQIDEALAFLAEAIGDRHAHVRSEEHTSELQSLMRISYAVFCLKKKTHTSTQYGHSKYDR